MKNTQPHKDMQINPFVWLAYILLFEKANALVRVQ